MAKTKTHSLTIEDKEGGKRPKQNREKVEKVAILKMTIFQPNGRGTKITRRTKKGYSWFAATRNA
jgi:hypothetical protein